MENPLKKMVDQAKAAYNPPRGGQDPAGLGTELAEKARMKKEAEGALKGPVSGATPAKKGPAITPPSDKIKPGAQYGDKPGEQRIDVKDMTKPLGSFKKGGDVPKTGVYKLHEGEKVLTENQHDKLKHAMSLAASSLAHKEPEQEKEPMPKKEVREMRIRKGASGGHVIIHVHNAPHIHPDEEHVTSDTDGLVEHVMHHMTEPNDGEMEAENGESGIEESKESPATQQMEKALGYE